MTAHEEILLDNTLALGAKGYGWLPDLRRRNAGRPAVTTRLLGRHTTALHGREAVRFFYDEKHVKRQSALPGPVLDTLFGRGAVHTLDGRAHAARKALFMSLLKDGGGVAALEERARSEWDDATALWAAEPRIELFTEVGVVITRAVCAWAGVPLTGTEARQVAADLLAMVDGFATAGPRHWRARRARVRQEEQLMGLIEGVRKMEREHAREGGMESEAPEDSALRAVALHRDHEGELLDPHTAAVEVLNIIRPTAAVAWFMAFTAHALHRRPGQREALRDGDREYAEAFAHELRRFYPFVPFVAGLAAGELTWQGTTIPEGSVVLLDVYGHHHDPELWSDPYTFDPTRFLGREPAGDELIAQGGGDAARGHRCPGEDITVALLRSLAPRLARMEYDVVPDQDLTIPLRRVPTRPRSGFLMTGVSAGSTALAAMR